MALSPASTTLELNEDAVASPLDDAAMMQSYGRIN
jgi:hypothetical protein